MAKNRRVKMVNYNQLFAESPNARDLIEKYYLDPSASILDLIFSKSEGNIGYEPTCECGAFVGKVYENHVCPHCLTTVSSDFTSNFKPTNWVTIPEDMPPVIHPRFYILLRSLGGRNRDRKKGSRGQVKKQNVKIIDYVLDPEEILPPDLAEGIHGQGFTYFHQHHPEIMAYLLLQHPKYSKTDAALACWELYQKLVEEDNLFVRSLPLLNPIFHPMHIRGRSKTMDKTSDLIMPAIINLVQSSYTNRHLVTSPRYADRELWSIFSKYIAYIKKIMETKIGDKFAIVRRHNVAARFHFTGRGVITPITDRHMGDEIYIPWNIGMMIFQLEIINLLTNRKDFTFTEAIDYFYTHINEYSDTLDWCFKTLIKECQTKGIPSMLNRNPTLIRESFRAMFITRVKIDVNDRTLSVPPRIAKGFNADHDGDELNLFIPKEQGIYIFLARMHPKEGILSETDLSVSHWVKPTTEAFIHSNEFLHYGRDDTGYCQLELPKDRSVVTKFVRELKQNA